MAPTNVEKLKSQTEIRNRHFQRVQRAFDLIKKGEEGKEEFLLRVPGAEDAFEKFQATLESITILNQTVEKEHVVECDQALASLEELYYKIKAHEAKFKENVDLSSSFSRDLQAPTPRVNLPTLNIPMFNGEISEFPAWKSLYDQLIHSNEDLSLIQKFSYLKSYLGPAARSSIDSIGFDGVNYPLAYKSLIERYLNKRVLANAYLSKILTFQKIPCDNIESLRHFLDTFHVSVESLRQLNINNLAEFLLLQIGLNALDPVTRRDFETENIKETFPTFSALVKFVRHKCSILELTKDNSGKQGIKQVVTHRKALVMTSEASGNPSGNPSGNQSFGSPAKKVGFKCSVCHVSEHRIASCPKFMKLDIAKRFNLVKELKLCFACLSSTHTRLECQSTYRCKHCGSSAHHSLLHYQTGVKSNESKCYESKSSDQKPHGGAGNNQSHVTLASLNELNGADQPQNQSQRASSSNEPNHHVAKSYMSQSASTVLLGTAVVQIQDMCGVWHLVRCIVDPASQISVVSNRLAQLLNLPRKHSSIHVSGIGAGELLKSKGTLCCNVLPHPSVLKVNQQPLSIETTVLPKIASGLTTHINKRVLERFAHLGLADLTYRNDNIDPTIDLLIGAEHYCSILDTSLQVIPGQPMAIPTQFGWLLLGRVPSESENNSPHHSFFVEDLSSQIQKFWELEEVPQDKLANPEDISCEEHFVATHQRDATGKYILRLPFKNGSPPDLGSNQTIALQRLKSLDAKLDKNPVMKNLYHENLQAYVDQDHMRLASSSSPYYLIHHGVFKATSSTTKLRVVFDPNIPSNTSKNLAQSLMVGPKLQSDIGDLLVNFRLNAVAIICDIQAMYRSIWIAPEDQKYQRILWHPNDNSNQINEYELTTVTFGLPPSPFQAQRVLQQLAKDEGDNYPEAAHAITNSVYVDDIVTGGHTIQDTIALKDQIISLLGKGGFHVRKWASSHQEVIADLSEDLCEKPHSLGSTESIKVLGIHWDPKTDSLLYLIGESGDKAVTKRQVLSFIAKIYDINGLLSPITIWLKIFMQRLWLHKDITWDSPLPLELRKDWNLFVHELYLLKDVSIPRYVLSANHTTIDLVGFADGSSVAICGAIYLRVQNSDMSVHVHLLRAKTRVAPLTTQSIPRLELCAALLLARVLKSLSFLTLPIRNTYLFSDSTVVLAWLKTPPHCLKTYVANRVASIIELTSHASWHHVSTHENSADPGSRGLYPSELINHPIWFSGPKFLLAEPKDWPLGDHVSDGPIPEMKSMTTLTVNTEKPYLITVIERFSSLLKLERVFAFVRRFIHNLKFKSNRRHGSLSILELHESRLECIKLTQQHYFQSELKQVGKNLPVSSNLLSLSPCLDPQGLLMVGGRLSQAPIPRSAKHPILLPSNSHLAVLLITHFHLISIHGGPKLVQSLLQRQYWIIGARSLIRKVIFKCITCFKTNAKPSQPIMADIPLSRYAQGRPFINVGVDLAGPFPLKSGPRRNSPITKAWFAIFICMATKAIHIELLTSLSTEVFLASLDRFVGRRGLPQSLFSDRGTNFVGASRHLSEVHTFLNNASSDIHRHLSNQQISWIFNPPSAPNFGGLWEAGVKSIKSHLMHVIKDHSFTYEEFNTLLIQIEAILNSRPICATNSHPDDGVDTLTPGHFLVGCPLLTRPEVDVSDEYIPPAKRWSLIRQASQCFWKRWRHDYLNTLIQRSKWTKDSIPIKVNDVVIIQGQPTPSHKWPLGVVTKLLPGPDNIVRVVSLRTPSGVLVRPVSKLAVLPISH